MATYVESNESTEPPASALGKMIRLRKKLFRILLLSGMAIGALWLSGVRLFAFPGESMVPAVLPGDYFVGLIGLWGHRSPKRFDMLIFDLPPTSKWAERRIPWMKRLVGLPGEQVRLSGADLFINGQKIEASFLHWDRGASREHFFEVQLGRDEFCVLGDNLDRSFDDSRSMGPISRSLIKGRVVLVIHRSSAKMPNQAQEPTPTSVTHPANQSESK